MLGSAIDKEMAYYFLQLSEAEKKAVLSMVKTFLQKDKGEFVSEDIEGYNNDIDEALNEVQRGEFYSH
jgi:hypothetical protein